MGRAHRRPEGHGGNSITFTMTLRSDLDNGGAVAPRTRTWSVLRNQWLLSSDLMSGDNEC